MTHFISHFTVFILKNIFLNYFWIQFSMMIFFCNNKSESEMGVEQSSEQLQYCYEMPNSKEPGFSPVFRNPQFKNELTKTPDPKVKNYRDAIIQSFVEKYPHKKAMGKIISKKVTKEGSQVTERSIHSLSYRECFEKAELLGKAMLGLKLEHKQETRGMKFIGIYSKNRIEWILTDLACILFGLTSVPLYDTLGLQNLSYCLNQTQLKTLFLTADTLNVLLSLKDHGNLKNLVLFDRVDQETVKRANKMGFSIVDFQSLVQEGKRFANVRYEEVKVQADDVHTFSYTSGTTGPPKGAMLTHGNFICFLSAFQNLDLYFTKDDVHLSFLPLPHVFERLVVACIFWTGAELVIYDGDVNKLKEDCQLVKPTLFLAVPRLFNKIVQKVQQGFELKTGLEKCLVEMAVKSKSESIQQDGTFSHLAYDNLIFDKVKAAFGGRIRQLVSGGAPLSKKNFQFMEMIMSCPLYEIYGQTENTGAAFVRCLRDKLAGHVGGVVSNLEFRLADIPEMMYTYDDKDEEGNLAPRGEIWLRGPAVIAGYYKLQEKTQETITKDGWLKTGDVGVLVTPARRLKIIDRKKNIFKLQQGEYVAPEKVQIIYSRCPLIQEVFLHGDSLQNYCVSVIKPRKENFMELAKKNNINGSFVQLCRNPEMKRILIKEIFNFGKSSGLNSFEQAKNIFVESINFVDKKILTNTLKLQRFEAKTVYREVIEDLYKQGELPVK